MVKVLIQTDSRYPVDRKIIRIAIDETLAKNKAASQSFEISVAVVGARKMKSLAEKFTDSINDHQILTFPFEDISQSSKGFINPPDGILRLGEIVLCWPEVLGEASRDDMMVDEKVYELVSHGVEHLLGKHHE